MKSNRRLALLPSISRAPVSKRQSKLKRLLSVANRLAIVRSPGLLVPEKMKVVFRYQSATTFTIPAGLYVMSQISMNSAYDPLYTVGGGVCTGFAEWMALYARYFVKRARCVTQPVTNSNPGDILFTLALRSNEATAGVVPTLDMITESRNCCFHMMVNGTTSYTTLEDVRDPAQFEGLSGQNKNDLSGSLAADPTIQPVWYVGAYGVNGHTIQTMTLVEYETELYSPNVLTGA